MFVIVVYDINQKRVSKFHKICRKYLYPIQRSVFEGDINQRKLKQLQRELEYNMNCNQDSICIYELDSNRDAYKLQMGIVNKTNYIL